MSGKSLLKEGECMIMIVFFFCSDVRLFGGRVSSYVKVLDLSLDWRWC